MMYTITVNENSINAPKIPMILYTKTAFPKHPKMFFFGIASIYNVAIEVCFSDKKYTVKFKYTHHKNKTIYLLLKIGFDNISKIINVQNS